VTWGLLRVINLANFALARDARIREAYLGQP